LIQFFLAREFGCVTAHQRMDNTPHSGIFAVIFTALDPVDCAHWDTAFFVQSLIRPAEQGLAFLPPFHYLWKRQRQQIGYAILP
jgi:hypothetical protein